MKKKYRTNGVITLQIQRAYSLKNGIRYAICLMSREVPTRCAKCHRGIVIRWPMGYEPVVTPCRVCGAETDVEIQGLLTAK